MSLMSWIRKIITPPVFPEDEDKTRIAGFLNIIAWAGGLFIVLAAPGLIYFNETATDRWVSLGLIVAFLALLGLTILLLLFSMAQAVWCV